MARVIDLKKYEEERKKDVEKILDSKAIKKVVVAGPGTGKSYLFEQAIKNKRQKGGKKFLAITFVGKLTDSLADDLAGLAETYTLHGYARKLVLGNMKSWSYYPNMLDVISNDLQINGINKFEIGDKNYTKRSNFYKSVGKEDVVLYALKICEKDLSKIPVYDLILIDEFQDFNEIEAKFIDILATKNEILIVGDDDQALYDFKGSFSKYIRDKYSLSNKDYESHTLKFCSRCTEVIVNSLHNVIDYFVNLKRLPDRIKKDYVCYLPGKKEDSDINQYIEIWAGISPNLIAKKIAHELSNLLFYQKIKTVLIIGEGRSCKSTLSRIANKLSEIGFKNVISNDNNDLVNFDDEVLNAYKFLAGHKNRLLAWRLLVNKLKSKERKKIIKNNFNDGNGLINSIPQDFKNIHENNLKTFIRILTSSPSVRSTIGKVSIDDLKNQIVINEKNAKEIFMDSLFKKTRFLGRPLVNLDITVCNILGSKGLGADVVFLIGFDQGKFPVKTDPTDSEIYQLLVSLTRAKKRIYLINTRNRQMSSFLMNIDKKNYRIT